MPVFIGLVLAFGTVGAAFTQDTPKKEEKKAPKKKDKGKGSTERKEGK
jgi:hypothetical protein